MESEGFGTWKWPVFGFGVIHYIGLVFILVFDGVKEKATVGLWQLAINYMVQNCYAGEQNLHWDKTNKGNYHLKLMYAFYLSLIVPVRLLLSSKAVLHHMNG